MTASLSSIRYSFCILSSFCRTSSAFASDGNSMTTKSLMIRHSFYLNPVISFRRCRALFGSPPESIDPHCADRYLARPNRKSLGIFRPGVPRRRRLRRGVSPIPSLRLPPLAPPLINVCYPTSRPTRCRLLARGRRSARRIHAWRHHAARNASLNHFDLARPPLLCEECLLWAVKAEQRIPTLGRIGLNPVALVHAGRHGRSKIDSGGAVGVGRPRRPWIALAAGARISLRGLQHGTGLVVVKGERPKFGRWDVWRIRD